MATPEQRADALARLYDLDLMLDDPGDLDLWLALADRCEGPILELAAGSGRLAIPLAEAGHEVTAVDIDPSMILRGVARARAAGSATEARLTWVEADLVGLELPDAGEYAMAFVGLNSLFLLDEETQVEAFHTMARHLAPGGLAVVDCWLPDAEDLSQLDRRMLFEHAVVEPESGNRVVKTWAGFHDAPTQTIRLVTIWEEGPEGEPPVRWVREDDLRLVSPGELRGLALAAGLEIEMLAGGYDLDPLESGSDRLILLATKPQQHGRGPGRRSGGRSGQASRRARKGPADRTGGSAGRP